MNGDRALQLAKHLVAVVQRDGAPYQMSGRRMVAWRDHVVFVRMETPFGRSDVPYSLHVYGHRGKVLTVHWTEPDDMTVRYLRRGDWEQHVLTLA